MSKSVRPLAALAGTLALHSAALILTAHASATTQWEKKGIPLPPVAIQVTLHAPQTPTSERAIPAKEEPPSPTLNAKPPRTDNNIILLTPPPEIEAGTPKPETPQTGSRIGLVGPTYFPTSALTEKPNTSQEPKVILPDRWLEASGQVRITLYISADGNVDDAVIKQSSLAPELSVAVINAFKALPFTPGKIGERRVPTVMTIEVDLSATLNNLH